MTINIDIIMPNRIGDSILALPAMVCLNQLIKKYAPKDYKVCLYSEFSMKTIFQSLGLFKVRSMNHTSKLRSWLKPSDRAFYLYNSSKNIGFKSKLSYGLQSGKKYAKYDIDTSYLDLDHINKRLSDDLIWFLDEERGLSLASIRYFGICIDLGYTEEQIRSCFNFSPDELVINKPLTTLEIPDKDYFVICMEAAYGKKVEAKRRWEEVNFFQLSRIIYNKFGIPSVYIGVDNSIPLPDEDFFIDYIKKLNIVESAELLRRSSGFAGNDSGPLHLAVLLHKHSVCITLIEVTSTYKPVFPEFTHLVWHPENAEDTIPVIENFLERKHALNN